MSVENKQDDDSLPNIPDLKIAQKKFLLQQNLIKGSKAEDLKKELIQDIERYEMGPFYKICCCELDWKMDHEFMNHLDVINNGILAKLDSKIEDAEKNLGESEIRDALLNKSDYLAKIGFKDEAISASKLTLDKTVGIGNRMDVVFGNIRIGLFYMDHDIIKTNIDKAKQMIEEGGDWDRRNRLKVYEGLYCMSIRDFSRSAKLFLETISTFTSYELMSYSQFVTYTVYVGMIAMERSELNSKIVNGSEILEVLHGNSKTRNYLFSLYDCQYGEFFQNLSEIEQILKLDRYLFPHYSFYVREMKIKAFAQLLESYRSLTLQYMSEAFNVTEEFMDYELSRFIADGRIHCKIDKVRGIVITNRPDSKNSQYQATIKHGDILLNRVQKLSRVINI